MSVNGLFIVRQQTGIGSRHRPRLISSMNFRSSDERYRRCAPIFLCGSIGLRLPFECARDHAGLTCNHSATSFTVSGLSSEAVSLGCLGVLVESFSIQIVLRTSASNFLGSRCHKSAGPPAFSCAAGSFSLITSSR